MCANKLVPGRTTDPANPEIETEAVSVFKDPRFRSASEHMIRLLESSDLRDLQRARDMKMCGRRPAVVLVKDGAAVGYLHARCRQRLCPFCQALNAAEVRQRLIPVVDERIDVGAKFSLLTLTIPHDQGDDLRGLFHVLFKAMRIFTRSKVFKKHVRGWARGVEVTFGPNGFHPHAHFIIEAKFWELDSLHRCWALAVLKANGPEVPMQSVDIKGLEVDAAKGLDEALGYPFKAADFGAIDLPVFRELKGALRNRHLVQSCKAWSRRAKELESERKDLAELADEEEGITRESFVELMRHCHVAETRQILLSLVDLLVTDSDFREIVAAIRDATRVRPALSWNLGGT